MELIKKAIECFRKDIDDLTKDAYKMCRYDREYRELMLVLCDAEAGLVGFTNKMKKARENEPNFFCLDDENIG